MAQQYYSAHGHQQGVPVDFADFIFRNFAQGGGTASFHAYGSPFEAFFQPQMRQRRPQPRQQRAPPPGDVGSLWRPVLMIGSIVFILFLSMLFTRVNDHSSAFSLQQTTVMRSVRYVPVRLHGSVQTVPYFVREGFVFRSKRHQRSLEDSVKQAFKLQLTDRCQRAVHRHGALMGDLQKFERVMKRHKTGTTAYNAAEDKRDAVRDRLQDLDMESCTLLGYAW